MMSVESVRAILGGKKTQTRRVLKLQPVAYIEGMGCRGGEGFGMFFKGGMFVPCPFSPDDRLWVKEAWKPMLDDVVFYKANYDDRQASEYVWMNPMFMPRRLSPVLHWKLRVCGVRGYFEIKRLKTERVASYL